MYIATVMLKYSAIGISASSPENEQFCLILSANSFPESTLNAANWSGFQFRSWISLAVNSLKVG